MGWLLDKVFSAIDADYRPTTSFTFESKGEFAPGNKVRDDRGWWKVTRVEPQYDSRNDASYYRGWAERSDGRGGCNCGRC